MSKLPMIVKMPSAEQPNLPKMPQEVQNALSHALMTHYLAELAQQANPNRNPENMLRPMGMGK